MLVGALLINGEIMMRKINWLAYWEQKKDGGHRRKDEAFLQDEYREKSLILGHGHNKLLDFGCGSAELLSYLSANAVNCYGCDFSKSMLEQAAIRLEQKSVTNVSLLHADSENVWDKVPDKLDIITCCGVVQYFDQKQLDSFLEHAIRRINASGKIILFDVIDKRYVYLWRCGFYKSNRQGSIKILFMFLKSIYVNLKILSGRDSLIEIGNSYLPEYFYNFSDKNKIECQVIRSRYYEYRYHVTLSY